MELGHSQGRSSALKAGDAPRWCSRNAPWLSPPSRPSSASRAPSGPLSRRSDWSRSSSHTPEVPLGVPQWNFSLTMSLRSQISAFLTWGCADNTPARTAGKRGLCCGDGKRFFSPSPLDHGLENKTSQSVGSFNIGMISFIFGSFTQNANGSSRSLHNTKGFFQPFSHVFYTHT